MKDKKQQSNEELKSTGLNEPDIDQGDGDDHGIRTILLVLVILIVLSVVGILIFGGGSNNGDAIGTEEQVQVEDLPTVDETTKNDRKQVIQEVLLDSDKPLSMEAGLLIREYILEDSLVGYGFSEEEMDVIGGKVEEAYLEWKSIQQSQDSTPTLQYDGSQ